MTILKYHWKSHVTLGTILVYFEKSYVVPPSCKVSQPGFKWFGIYDGGPFTPPPPSPNYQGWLGLMYDIDSAIEIKF